MKLQNKITGIVLTKYTIRALEGVDADKGNERIVLIDDETHNKWTYYTLAEFNKHWEDYEEKVSIRCGRSSELVIVNIRATNVEEAERIEEKIEALKRLKDNGFEFTGWKRDAEYCGDFTITATDQTSCDDKDLNLLFGGEE